MYSLIVFLHIIGLVVALGIPIATLAITRMAGGGPDGAALRSVPPRLAPVGWAGLALLVVTGLLMQAFDAGQAFRSFGGVWFWLKMVAVLGLLAAVYMIWQTMREVRGGNIAAAARMRMLGPAAMVAGLLAVLFAVLAMHRFV